MKTCTFLAIGAALLAASPVAGIRILQSNDDGWAENYLRTLNDALVGSGHDVILSAPAENKSGTGGLDVDPSPRTAACQYDSCPANTNSPVGVNGTNARQHWVNSYPATSMRYGIDSFAPQYWGPSPPDLAVSGPNVGSNLWLAVWFSGTVNAAVFAAHERGVPAIAFSGADDGALAWDQPPPPRSLVYAALANRMVDEVVAGGKPYLPDDTILNVNFGPLGSSCTRADDFQWVLTRINPAGLFSAPDVDFCGSDRLPTESDVIGRDGCWVTVSVGDASDRTTADAERQAAVLDKLGGLFSCDSQEG